MILYDFKCPDCGHEVSVAARMTSSKTVYCRSHTKATPMARVFSPVRVNWNGPKPSAWEMDPALKAHVTDPARSRAAFDEEHEEHESRDNVRSEAAF